MCTAVQYVFACAHDATDWIRTEICAERHKRGHQWNKITNYLPMECGAYRIERGKNGRCPDNDTPDGSEDHAAEEGEDKEVETEESEAGQPTTTVDWATYYPNVAEMEWHVPSVPVAIKFDNENPFSPPRSLGRQRRRSSIEMISPKSSPSKKKKAEGEVGLDPLASSFQPPANTLPIVGGKKSEEIVRLSPTPSSSISGTSGKENHVMDPLAPCDTTLN